MVLHQQGTETLSSSRPIVAKSAKYDSYSMRYAVVARAISAGRCVSGLPSSSTLVTPRLTLCGFSTAIS